MDEVTYHKINYRGSSKVIKRLCEESGNLVDYKADKSEIPVNTSDLYNDSGFITNLVDDLANYYLKSETYTQAEVNSLIGAISTLHIEVVQTLPTEDISTNTIYLVPKQTAGQNDTYDEYIYVNNNWEHIGSTDIDLTNYYTKTETDTLLDDKVDKVTGKGLSTEDYTTAEKTKLSGIETGAQVNVKPDWNATAGDDDEILNKPSLATVATTGDYDDLQNKPTIPDELADLSDDSTHRLVTDTEKTTWNNKSDFSGSYNDLTDKPTIPDELADLTDDSTHRLVTDTEKTTWNNKSDFSGNYNDLQNKPTIPDELADLTDDSTHRLVTDTEKSTWNNKSDFSGSYNDLTDKPTIPDELSDLTDDSSHRLVTDTEKTTWNAKSDLQPLIGTTLTLTPTQVKNAIEAGRPVAVTYTDSTYGTMVFTTFNVGDLGLTAAFDACVHISQTVSKKILVILGGEFTNDTWEFHPPTYMATEDEIPSITPNPATTTDTLTGLEIDGVGYAIQGGIGNAWLNAGGTNLNPSSTNPVDLNDLTTAGTYYCNDASLCVYVSHRPATGRSSNQKFTIVVQQIGSSGPSNLRQIYYEAGSVPRMYYRSKNGSSGSWTDWQGEALLSDTPNSWLLKSGIEITATSENPVDLNDVKTAGTYYCVNDSAVAYVSNKPPAYTSNKRFTLIVQLIGSMASCLRQIFISGIDNKVYWRFCSSNTWRNWEEMAYADKMWRLADGVALQATAENHIDLNDLVNAGTYYIASDTADRYDNKPVNNTSRFTLIVQAVGNADANRVKQFYMYIGAHAIYERYKNGSTANWNPWKKFAYSEEFATVATTGSYNDLTDKPTIPAAQVNSDWNANSGVAQILNKPTSQAASKGGTTESLVTTGEKWTWNRTTVYWSYTNSALAHSVAGYKSALEDMYSQRATNYPEFNQSATVTAHLILGTANGSATAIIDCNGANYFTAFIFDYYVNRAFRLRYANGTWIDNEYAYLTDLPTKLSDLTDDVVNGNYVKVTNSIGQQVASTGSGVPLVLKGNHAKNTWLGFKNSANTTMGYIGVHEDYGPVYYDNALRGIALKADVTWKYSFKFTLNYASSGKWYSFYRKGISGTASCCYLVSIGVDQFVYTSGTTFTFLLASYYQQIHIFPVSASSQAVAWMPKFRSSADDTYRYLDFLCLSLPNSSYTNEFWINIAPLNYAGIERGDIFFSPTESVATVVQREYSVQDGTFRCATYTEVVKNNYGAPQTVVQTDANERAVLALQTSSTSGPLLSFKDVNGNWLGHLGVSTSGKPIFRKPGVSDEVIPTWNEVIAYSDGARKVIQCGEATIRNSTQVTVTFPTAFSSAPYVYITQHADFISTTNVFSFATANVFKNKFTIHCNTNVSTAVITWVAIGSP